MFRNLRWMPLVAMLALAACGDSGTNPLASGEFDPVATEQAVQDLQNHLNDDSDIMVSMGLAAEALAAAGGQPPLSLGRTPAPLSAKVIQSYSMVASAAAPIFPVELLGVTFEWSVVEGSYVPTARTGAPSNGVTFILYAIDPLTRRPVEPLVETGFLDLTDEGSEASTRLGLYAESGGTPLVDYFIDLSYALLGENDIGVEVVADGYISDGEDQLDFALSETATVLGSTSTIDLDMVYSLSLHGRDVGVTVEMHGEFDYSGESPIESATAELRIHNGTEFVDFEMTLGTDNSLDGVIEYNGTPVVTIGGTEADPVFTRSDGEQLTVEQVAALIELFDMIEDVFDLVEGLFEPFGGLGI